MQHLRVEAMVGVLIVVEKVMRDFWGVEEINGRYLGVACCNAEQECDIIVAVDNGICREVQMLRSTSRLMKWLELMNPRCIRCQSTSILGR